MTLRDALARVADELAAAGVPSPRVDAEHLVCAATGLTRTQLYLDDRELRKEEARRLRDLVSRRRAREPLAYVLGEWGFRRLTLKVDPRVLIPRPETEIVVERCLALLAGHERPAVLDVGTGSAAIALAIADEHPGARVRAIDASAEALAVAEENAGETGLAVELVLHDATAGLPPGPYDLVVANPPYVPAAEIPGLAAEVRDWEPRAAILESGGTEAVIQGAKRVLRPGGWLVLETHWERARDVAGALAQNGYVLTRISEDLAGRERVVEGRWR
jgi:release factor glutamine methyltransferase